MPAQLPTNTAPGDDDQATEVETKLAELTTFVHEELARINDRLTALEDDR